MPLTLRLTSTTERTRPFWPMVTRLSPAGLPREKYQYIDLRRVVKKLVLAILKTGRTLFVKVRTKNRCVQQVECKNYGQIFDDKKGAN